MKKVHPDMIDFQNVNRPEHPTSLCSDLVHFPSDGGMLGYLLAVTTSVVPLHQPEVSTGMLSYGCPGTSLRYLLS
jgi:hypothetical protein